MGHEGLTLVARFIAGCGNLVVPLGEMGTQAEQATASGEKM